jgi:hypothetical protein
LPVFEVAPGEEDGMDGGSALPAGTRRTRTVLLVGGVVVLFAAAVREMDGL